MSYLKLVKSNSIDNWYLIEKAEHGNVMTTVMDSKNSGFFYYSGRICDADVEGYSSEMLSIAEAIEKRAVTHFKRCAVDACDEDEVYFWSPRNSRMHGIVSRNDALNLAEQIRRELG